MSRAGDATFQHMHLQCNEWMVWPLAGQNMLIGDASFPGAQRKHRKPWARTVYLRKASHRLEVSPTGVLWAALFEVELHFQLARAEPTGLIGLVRCTALVTTS